MNNNQKGVYHKMTDINKYKNVSLSHDTYNLIDKMRKNMLVPNTIVSRAQVINILVNEKAKKLNGKVEKKLQPSAQCAIRKEKQMKLITMIIVVLTITSCSKYDPNDLLDPTSTVVKQIIMKGKQ